MSRAVFEDLGMLVGVYKGRGLRWSGGFDLSLKELGVSENRGP